MSEIESAKSAIEAAASNPKVASAIAAGNMSLGTAAGFDLIHGWLGVASLTVGIITGIVVLGIQLIRLEIAWRERRAAK